MFAGRLVLGTLGVGHHELVIYLDLVQGQIVVWVPAAVYQLREMVSVVRSDEEIHLAYGALILFLGPSGQLWEDFLSFSGAFVELACAM